MKLATILAILASASASASVAADPAEIVKLWPGQPPGEARDVGPEADITKPDDRPVAGRRVIRLGNVATPEMHVFLPDDDRDDRSAVVICPGGGFHILAWDLEGTEVAEWLNGLGVAAIVVKYRVPTAKVDPRWLPPVQDAERALSLTRQRAADWGIDPSRVGVLGFSAGGYTAGHVAVNHAKRAYDPVDAADDHPFRPDFAVLVYPAWFTVEDTLELKPELHPDKSAPPTFFVHAANDPVHCESSIGLFLGLKAAGVPAALHVFETGGHGYGLRPVDGIPVTRWPDLCEQWLRMHDFLN